MSLALDLYVQAFGRQRTERRAAYKNGVKAALIRIFESQLDERVGDYLPGTTDFDAYVAGRLEGHQIASQYIDSCKIWGVVL